MQIQIIWMTSIRQAFISIVDLHRRKIESGVSHHDNDISKLFVPATTVPAGQIDFVVYKAVTYIHISYYRLLRNNVFCAKCINGDCEALQ